MGAEQDAQAVVSGFIDAFNALDLERIMACFHDDAVYHNMPMTPVQGTGAIRAVIEGFVGLASEIDWVVLGTVSDGRGRVMNERLDRFLIQGQWLELPVMGAFEVDAGRIRAWRDYFDLGVFQRRLAEIQGHAG
ncbi:MAG: limonene-1,2-epoxide hydrolase family protein [Pseudomonadales bacterium]|jgi:limonene-1,2-epoxide hydrolase|nr:limonene-1,2-epoxide hydrolase family protein [Pseudomonadales bacterium]